MSFVDDVKNGVYILSGGRIGSPTAPTQATPVSLQTGYAPPSDPSAYGTIPGMGAGAVPLNPYYQGASLNQALINAGTDPTLAAELEQADSMLPGYGSAPGQYGTITNPNQDSSLPGYGSNLGQQLYNQQMTGATLQQVTQPGPGLSTGPNTLIPIPNGTSNSAGNSISPGHIQAQSNVTVLPVVPNSPSPQSQAQTNNQKISYLSQLALSSPTQAVQSQNNANASVAAVTNAPAAINTVTHVSQAVQRGFVANVPVSPNQPGNLENGFNTIEGAGVTNLMSLI